MKPAVRPGTQCVLSNDQRQSLKAENPSQLPLLCRVRSTLVSVLRDTREGALGWIYPMDKAARFLCALAVGELLLLRP